MIYYIDHQGILQDQAKTGEFLLAGFCDCGRSHSRDDPELVEAAITSRTRALMPVHLFGQAADMNPLLAIAQKYELRVIKGTSQAQGARYNGSVAGTLGDIGAFAPEGHDGQVSTISFRRQPGFKRAKEGSRKPLTKQDSGFWCKTGVN